MRTCTIKNITLPQPYLPVLEAMQHFTRHRFNKTQDQIWFLEHLPVFTQGRAGKSEHIIDAAEIPVVQSDRGGQVTYHAPGQLVIYPLLDISRLGISSVTLVRTLENIIIFYLKEKNISAESKQEAPGVYVDNKKIASIGLRIHKGRSYHGIALNVAMDMAPFSRIHPCGYKNMQMLQLRDVLPEINIPDVKRELITFFQDIFEYSRVCILETKNLEEDQYVQL